jgi:hypothetical protein
MNLRDTGYVFCDMARLDELGPVGPDTSELPTECADQWENTEAPCMGSRLRDAGVCWCAVYATASEFGLDQRGHNMEETEPSAEVLELEQQAEAAEY